MVSFFFFFFFFYLLNGVVAYVFMSQVSCHFLSGGAIYLIFTCRYLFLLVDMSPPVDLDCSSSTLGTLYLKQVLVSLN